MTPTIIAPVLSRPIGVTVLALLTSSLAHATLMTSVYAVTCNDFGTTHSECSFISSNPATGQFESVTGVADASYGQLHVVSTSDIRNVVGHIPATSTAYASFSDMITLTPRNDAMVNSIRLVWSYQVLDNGVVSTTLPSGSCKLTPAPVICGDLRIPGVLSNNEFRIAGEIGVGDPLSFFVNHDFEATATLTSIQLLGCQTDPFGRCNPIEMRPLTGFTFSSASGAAYNIEGATQIPEPAPVLLIALALGFAVPLKLKSRFRNSL